MSDRFICKKINSEDNIVISYLGRLDASKGVLDLIKAFVIFKIKNVKSKIILNIAGSGSQQSEIEYLANKNSSIKYYGSLPYNEIDGYLKASHFTVIPSKIDNLPTVGLESMMNETPLLISNTTGLAHYLEDGKECFKFDSNIEALILLFKRVEDNFVKQSQMAIHARTTFLNEFSMEKYCFKFSKEILK